MFIRPLEPADRPRLFSFWNEIARRVPYFFPVTEPVWWQALTDEQQGFMGLHLLPGTSLLQVAEHAGKIVGFAHTGRPNVDVGPAGVVERPSDVLVLRHLYFQPDSPEAGRHLLERALCNEPPCTRLFAFHHAHGMSCNAHHGKLHEAMPWVETALLEAGFSVEHENLYFVLDMQSASDNASRLDLAQTDEGSFQALLDGAEIGTARAVTLEPLTGGATADTVFLRWVGVREGLRGKGLGKRFLHALIHHYRTKGHRYMHLDTALTNTVAQSLYQRVGFEHKGRTRSYVAIR